ncbi:MAG TPA: HAD family hydrolase [Symbiobacteriaceae bacterium]|nr:HAD family hydrolase [Symbiobacteriaceae bacterium]
MNYRLLAMDVDGTLLGPGRGLSRRTLRALHRAREHGLEYTLVTGRQWAEAEVVVRRLDLKVPVVCQNGAHILDPVTRHDYYHERISLDVALAITGALDQAGVIYYHYIDQEVLVRRPLARHLLWGHVWPPRSLAGWAAWFRWLWESRRYMRILPVDDLAGALRRGEKGPSGITAWDGAPAAVATLPPELQRQVTVVQNNRHSWNITPACVSKEIGLARLAEMLGLAPAQVVAVGDSYNDIPMLRWAGLGVAMGNAPPEVKAAATAVTAGNGEDGVAALVDRLINEGD